MSVSVSADHLRKVPRVGITGSFGRGNYGDELYVQTYQHWFGPWAELHLMSNLPRPEYFNDFSKARVDLMDAIVLGGGDLLCAYKPKVDRDFIHPHYLRRPLHVAGIGVERNRPDKNPDIVNKWKSFLNHENVKSITTRDPGSSTWIEENICPSQPVGHHPDLVCALPLPQATKPKGAPILGIVTRHIKHPREYVLLAEIGAKMASQGWRIQHIIGGVREHGKKDFENSKLLEIPGKETVYSEDLDEISRAIGACSLVLSMKLHTTIVATMYGVPTICVNPVVKAKQFLKSIDREELAFSPNDRKIIELIDSGVPEVPMDKVGKLREEASDFMRSLSQKIWNDYRATSPDLEYILEEQVRLP
ncbi:hypothetical protein GZ77_17465 [Endozoicomonas montiporae]|uniref:Polysaccharide pyruvyl transferase domain-containing protein n=1 Tax=Endozoicomonas montiporae TaxID=1027273 RepID=A0A081N1L9_9GAMM|nr:hypothetical protein GZ77_17465 [Endozoicomonas montiporae]